MSVRALSVAVIACLLSGALSAQVLYRYTDKNGRVVVSDRPPAEGKYERVESDPNVNVIQSPRPVAPTTEGTRNSYVNKRDVARDALAAALATARKRVEETKAALEAGREPEESEWRPIQVPPDNFGKPNKNGQVTAKGGKIVCPIDPYGKPVCVSGSAPNESYHERIERLEEALKSAEEALREAERRYRRESPD